MSSDLERINDWAKTYASPTCISSHWLDYIAAIPNLYKMIHDCAPPNRDDRYGCSDNQKYYYAGKNIADYLVLTHGKVNMTEPIVTSQTGSESFMTF